MTVPEVSPGSLAYLGVIQGAVAGRASTAEIWQAIRDAQATESRTYPEIGFADVNALRSFAATNRNAMERLNLAPEGATLGPEMIGLDISARTAVARSAAPEWWARLQLHGIDETGEEQTSWLTITTIRKLPSGRDELYRLLDAQVTAAGHTYGLSTVAWGTLSLSAV